MDKLKSTVTTKTTVTIWINQENEKFYRDIEWNLNFESDITTFIRQRIRRDIPVTVDLIGNMKISYTQPDHFSQDEACSLRERVLRLIAQWFEMMFQKVARVA